MKRTMNNIAAAALLLSVLLAPLAYAQNPNLGTSGAQFLKIPVGGRAGAMGGAYIANASDANSLFWNPAGIVNVRSNDLSFSHTALWATIALDHAAYAHTIEGVGTIGVSVTVLSMDRMEITTELEPEGTGQFFDAQDLSIGASFARRLTEDFSVGVTAKYIQEGIWNEQATGLAFDVGTQYRIGYKDLTIGMSMMNFGGDLRFGGRDLNVKYDQATTIDYNRLTPAQLSTEDYPLPLAFQVGLAMTAYSAEHVSVLLAADVCHPNDNNEQVNAGTEIRLFDILSLRGGYRFGYDTDRATFGAGVEAPLGDARITFDYAYATYSLLPDVSRFSVGITF